MRGEVLTPAKLNWDLRVLGRRADGFHELRSWFLVLDLCDRLVVEAARAAAPGLGVAGPRAAGVPSDGGNLVLRADAAWRAAFPRRAARMPPLRWTLEKWIPHGAGLGGGSGNAAGALALLELAAGAADADPARLRTVAADLGSDVPFFLEHEGGMEWRGGRGEQRLARAPLPAAWFLLALPPCTVPTAAAYAALAAAPWTESGREAFHAGAPASSPGPNDLADAAARIRPELAAWRAAAAAAAPAWTMSGSGSAHFAAFAREADARAAAARLRVAAPGEALVVAALDRPALRPSMAPAPR